MSTNDDDTTTYRVKNKEIHTSSGTYEVGDVFEPTRQELEAFSDNLEPAPGEEVTVQYDEDGNLVDEDTLRTRGRGAVRDVKSATQSDGLTTNPEADAGNETGGDVETADEARTETENEIATGGDADTADTGDEAALPDDYDDYSVSEVEEWAEDDGRTDDELDAALEYERNNEDRKTAIEALEESRNDNE